MRRIKISTELTLRSYFVFFIIIVGFIALAIRVFCLQTINFDYYQKKVVDQLTTESTISSERGSIYDANGEVLATNVTSYRIFISPSSIQKAMQNGREGLDEFISRELCALLGTDYDTVYALTQKKGSLDATVMRNADDESADKVLDFIANNSLSNVLYVEAQSKRYYKHGDLATHVLGFTGTDGKGLYGLEYYYNKELAGVPGKYITARDSYGNEMPYEYQSYIDAVDGYDLHTTIDVKIQAILEEQLKAAFEESAAKAGVCGIVMNVNTGAVLGMATYPDFNNNSAWTLSDFYQAQLEASGFAEDSKEYSSLRSSLLQKMWQNKSITDTYIPGSTFKIITSAMGLEMGVVSTGENFTCKGSYKVAGEIIHCNKTRGHGLLTFAQGLQQSCNPILMTVGARVGTDAFYQYVKNFGYLERTGIDLPGEARGIFYNEKNFGIVDLAVSSFGQNFKVNVIQHLTAISSIANGGKLVSPYLVDSMTDAEGKTIWEHGVSVRRQVVSSSVCETLASVLEEGVSGNGGSKNAYVAGYRVAAKTGTSEKIGDDKKMRICSCVAFAPADDPEIAMIIVADEPTAGTLYGGVVAAPYVANCLEQMLPYLGVEAIYTDEEAAKLEVEIPDFAGEVSYTAQSKLSKLGLDCEIVGVGTIVTAQVPAAGTMLGKDTGKVVLYVGDSAPIENIRVPDVVGMSASAANKVLINAGLNISVKGSSNHGSGSGPEVIEQFPAAGTVVGKGDVVTVTFRYLDIVD
jgi:stage V sporulation protein D (sporulation-specific penicillin-binding protein)